MFDWEYGYSTINRKEDLLRWLDQKGWKYQLVGTWGVLFVTERKNTFEYDVFYDGIIKHAPTHKEHAVHDFSDLCAWVEENDK